MYYRVLCRALAGAVMLSGICNVSAEGLYVRAGYRPTLHDIDELRLEREDGKLGGVYFPKGDSCCGARTTPVVTVNSDDGESNGEKDGWVTNLESRGPSYPFKYNGDKRGMFGAVGYSGRLLRVEIELSHFNFDVAPRTEYNVEEYGREVFLVREDEKPFTGRASSGGSKPENADKVASPKLGKKFGSFVSLRDTGVSGTSMIAHICYDTEKVFTGPIAPYVCGGYGVDFIRLFGRVRPSAALEVKVGLHCNLNRKTQFIVSGFVHKALRTDYSGLPTNYVPQMPEYGERTDDVYYQRMGKAEASIGFMGVEIGLRRVL